VKKRGKRPRKGKLSRSFNPGRRDGWSGRGPTLTITNPGFPLLPPEDALEALKKGPRSSERVKPQGFTLILGTEPFP
jgi:hypothetical protein